ncbi:MAG: phosphatase PAP2 family protein [Candidatus Aenigmatarchaeota archaeon]
MLAELDQAIFTAINTGLSHPALDFVFLSVTNYGSIFFWIFFALFLLIKNRDKKSFLGIAIMLVLGNIGALVLKEFFAIPRPTGRVLSCEAGFGFPSAHATNAFAGAVIFAKLHKGVDILVYVFAVLTAVSRIYLGVHYPSDVLAGSVLGLIVGFAVLWLPLDRFEAGLTKWYRKSFK